MKLLDQIIVNARLQNDTFMKLAIANRSNQIKYAFKVAKYGS